MSLLWARVAYLDDGDSPYYHATPHEFSAGDHIIPAGKHRTPMDWGRPNNEKWRNNRVWMTRDPYNARMWHHDDDKINVYEVQPVGTKHHNATDYDMVDGEGTENSQTHDQYQARGAVVVRKLHPDEYRFPHGHQPSKWENENASFGEDA